MKKVNIAILGLGTVGGGTYEALRSNNAGIKKNYGVDVAVKKILEINPKRGELFNIPEGVITPDYDSILKDKEIGIIVEVVGGATIAKDFILKAFAHGKTVVTANKELIAKYWPELENAARENKCGFYFEASCVGGVPIIRTLTESMQANNIQEMYGIVNGTTNYILSKMAGEGWDYDTALKTAQQLGYAEADPTSDVEAFDAAYKLSILSSIAFHTPVPYNLIYREGISKITALDIAGGRELGYVIKLLAVAKRNGKNVEARVHPAFVPVDHPLASVGGSFNAVHLHGDFVDDIMLYGRGAGAHPTASAIVSDIVFAANAKTHKYCTFKNTGEKEKAVHINEDFNLKYYFRVTAQDKVGVLAKITAVLGKNNVSISAINQAHGANGFAPITFLTHETAEKSMLNAIERIRELDCISSIDSLIRVI